jgi:hypothetical protein
MVQDHFLQAAARITVMVRDRHSARSIPRRGFGSPSALPPRAVIGAPSRPKCRLPKSPCLAPSSTSLLRHSRWLVTGCLPPLKVAKFEQRVLYGRGPAQVGFGVLLSSFHSLTLSSGGILSPEPLRLTRPEGAKEDCCRPFGAFSWGEASGPGAYAPGYSLSPLRGCSGYPLLPLRGCSLAAIMEIASLPTAIIYYFNPRATPL